MIIFDQIGVPNFFFRPISGKNSKFGVFSYQNFQGQMSVRVLPIRPKLGDGISTNLTPVESTVFDPKLNKHFFVD